MASAIVLCLLVVANADDFCPQEFGKHFCTNPSKPPAGCTPRRCCGNPNAGPVMQGVDFVDLFHCNVELGKPQEQCVPQFAGGEVSSNLNGYSFWFLTQENKAKFDADPAKYAPQIGGFCAFSPSHYDVTGAGMWCSCPTSPTKGYSFHNNKSYWFLFDHAHDDFEEHVNGGSRGSSLENSHKEWAVLLEENNATELNCFNTQRFVPTDINGKCLLQVCRSFRHCSDCPALPTQQTSWLA